MIPGPEELALAVRTIRAGGLVAFPTETVYGLGADALRSDAVAQVFALKGRPQHNPLIVHIAGEEHAASVAGEWPHAARELARAFWPGPLSIIVPKGPRLPGIITGNGPTVALRCPDHPVALALLTALGTPLVGPSANRSGRISPTTADHVRSEFPELLVLDGGPCRTGIESTVVTLAADRPKVLRPGAVPPEAIASVLGMPIERLGQDCVERSLGGEAPLPSPGMLASHYAPSTPARLIPREQFAHVWATTRGAAVLAYSGRRDLPGWIAMPTDASAYAARLYAALREADACGAEVILIEAPEPSGSDAALWEAVLDRLRRATAPR